MLPSTPMTTPSTTIVETAVPLNLDRTFHYRVPSGLIDRALPGRRVFVPFGSRRLTAYILAVSSHSEQEKLRDIISVLDEEPLWTDGELEFFRWVGRYYRHPLGEVLRTALPAGINLQAGAETENGASSISGGQTIRSEQFYRAIELPEPPRIGAKAAEVLQVLTENGELPASDLRRRFGTCTAQLKRLVELGLVTGESREVYRDPFRSLSVEPDTARELRGSQLTALTRIVTSLETRSFAPFLLHGVTGSGKTEVYLQAIARVLEQGGNALVLVPEISLTPQMVRRFRARFSDAIAILHSGLSDGERYDEWRRIRRGLVRIVIGARSAIFAPLSDLRLIVVDEEHEASFKQGDGLRYNARDLALVRGQMEGCSVVLGSATPLVTSINAVRQGRLELLELPARVAGRPMPVVETVPMPKGGSAISPRLAETLTETLQAGQQAMVFLNRRGFATYLVCSDCGEPLSCPDCSVTLTYHRQRGQSICHYCDFSVPAPGTCPACGGLEMKEFGAGTERIEHELKELFPAARIMRMDSDTTSGRGGHDRILTRMSDGSVDILVGTQMIAKGHDFPGVTLVGVVQGDAGLHMPDFRSSERTFQVLSQVIGRAGRGIQPGRVLIQAHDPSHYAIQCAVDHDFQTFCTHELAFRSEAGYPPFSHLVCLGFSGTHEETVETASLRALADLTNLRKQQAVRAELLGPAPAPLYRLRGRFRRQILIKAPSRNALRTLLETWLPASRLPSTVRLTVDIDPIDML